MAESPQDGGMVWIDDEESSALRRWSIQVLADFNEGRRDEGHAGEFLNRTIRRRVTLVGHQGSVGAAVVDS